MRSRSVRSTVLLAVALFAVAGAPAVAASSHTTVSIEDATVSTGDTTTVDVTLTEIPAGLAGYNVSVDLAQGSGATITDASVHGFDINSTNVSTDGTRATVKAVDLNDRYQSGDGPVTLGTLTVRGDSPTETELTVDVEQIDDDTGSRVDPAIDAGELVVSDTPDPIGDNPAPTDLDGDGLYEDVNGNDRFDVMDLVTLFVHREDPVVNDQIEYFDFNQNGRDVLDFGDITALYDEL